MPKRSFGAFTGLRCAPFAVCLATLLVFSLDRLVSPLTLTDQAGSLSLAASLALIGIHAGVQLIVLVLLLSFETIAARAGALLATLVSGLVGCAGFLAVGIALSSGDWISEQSYAWLLPILAGVLGFLTIAGTSFVALTYPYRKLENNTKFRLVSLAFGVLCATFLFVDAVALKRIYPQVHILLYASAALFAGTAAHRFGLDIFENTKKRSHILLYICCAFVITPTLYLCSNMNNGARSEVMLKSQVAANLVRYIPSKRGNTLFNVLNRIDAYSEPPQKNRQANIEDLNIEKDWNIILIVADALRADALLPSRQEGQIHASTEDTPFLNEWLKNAYRFHYAYAQGNSTEISMPAMFRSILPFEADNDTTIPLGSYISSHGRTPLAAVNSLFFEPRKETVTKLLTGFEKLAVYQENAMHQEVSQMLRLVEEERGNPFFAWFHFYCTHAPGFAGTRLLKETDGSWPVRYKQSLKWLDSELESLIAGLREKGVLDKTVIIITGDHGEGLGNHGLETHGSYMFEEEVRVPLSIWIPGARGGDIRSTVGNVDIVPTVAQLVGAPINPGHRGRSLLPLMVDQDSKWDHAYYMQNFKGTILAIVKGRQKLIYHPRERVFFRYDLQKDPKEKTNLYSSKPESDHTLVDHLVFANPRLFAGEMTGETTRMMLSHRLNTVDLSKPSKELNFVLKVANFDRSRKTSKTLMSMFDATQSDAVRALIFRRAYSRDKRNWSRTMAQHLTKVAGQDSELALIKEMAALGQPALVSKFVAGRFSWWLDNGDLDAIATWLEFVGNWRILAYGHFAPLFLRVLEILQQDTSKANPHFEKTLILTLKNIASLSARVGEVPQVELEQAILPYLRHETPSIRAAACYALWQVGTTSSFSSISKLLGNSNEPLQVKQAAMRAIAKIDKKRAVPLIVQGAKELQLTLDAINLLGRIGGLEAKAYLENVVDNHYNKTIKSRARRQLKRVKKRLK